MLNTEQWLSRPRIVCGIMSGTSLDGIDVAIAEFSPENTFSTICHHSFPIPDDLRQVFLEMISHEISIGLVSWAQFALAEVYAEAVRALCERENFPFEKIEAVAVHGQTVWHSPSPKEYAGIPVSSTLQLCSLPALAQKLGKIVAGDFRSADIALGGQGAPLVPVFDRYALSDPERDVIALNIGGMANITILPWDASVPVRAFDTGPGNVWIDEAMRKYFGKNYDEGGKFARDGRTMLRLLDELKKIEFIRREPPKSTGREFFSKENFSQYIRNFAGILTPPEDVVRTLTAFSAWSIAENIRLFAKPAARLIVSGGGAHNDFLLELLREELPQAEIIRIDELGISSDAKEALCFAYLGWRTLAGLPGNIPSVTGASGEAVLGAIAFS